MPVRSIVQYAIAINIPLDDRALPVDQVDSRSGKGNRTKMLKAIRSGRADVFLDAPPVIWYRINSKC